MSTKERKHIFTWKIKNISVCNQKKGECLQSPVFQAESLYESSWCLDLYNNGSGEGNEGWVACYLRLCRNNAFSEIETDFKVELLNAAGNIITSSNTKQIFDNDNEKWGFYNIIKRSELLNNNCYFEDFISVRLEILVKLEKYPNAKKYPLCSENTGVTNVDYKEYFFKFTVRDLNSNCSEVRKLPYTETSHVEIAVHVPEDDIKIMIRRIEDLTESQYKIKDIWEFPTFLKRTKLNSEKDEYLRNDCITLQLEIKLSNVTRSEFIEYKESTFFTSDVFLYEDGKEETCSLKEDIKRLYKDKIHADFKLHVADKTILAHKNILSLRSPVFMAMFDSKMTENETGSVSIPDLDAKTVNSLLEYMYMGTLENLDCETALKLLVASDKYQVLALKEKSARFLITSLSEANVCNVLMVANLVQHKFLEGACTKYIKDNSECIFFSDEWKILIEKNLQLAMKTVTEVSKLIAIGQK